MDHFFSQLALLESSQRSGSLSLDGRERERLVRDFSRLIAPALGVSVAEDLAYRTLERLKGRPPGALRKLGGMGAFFLGEYEDAMSLEEEDWEEIRETLEDASGEMDIRTLTALMGELLSRGVLDRRCGISR